LVMERFTPDFILPMSVFAASMVSLRSPKRTVSTSPLPIDLSFQYSLMLLTGNLSHHSPWRPSFPLREVDHAHSQFRGALYHVLVAGEDRQVIALRGRDMKRIEVAQASSPTMAEIGPQDRGARALEGIRLVGAGAHASCRRRSPSRFRGAPRLPVRRIWHRHISRMRSSGPAHPLRLPGSRRWPGTRTVLPSERRRTVPCRRAGPGVARYRAPCETISSALSSRSSHSE